MKKIIYILILVAILISITMFHVKSEYHYVTSQYSKYCYVDGYANKNIKIKVYYKSLEECGKPLKI